MSFSSKWSTNTKGKSGVLNVFQAWIYLLQTKLCLLLHTFYIFKKILPNSGILFKNVFDPKLFNNPLAI